jgi:hypothetical protein
MGRGVINLKRRKARAVMNHHWKAVVGGQGKKDYIIATLNVCCVIVMKIAPLCWETWEGGELEDFRTNQGSTGNRSSGRCWSGCIGIHLLEFNLGAPNDNEDIPNNQHTRLSARRKQRSLSGDRHQVEPSN